MILHQVCDAVAYYVVQHVKEIVFWEHNDGHLKEIRLVNPGCNERSFTAQNKTKWSYNKMSILGLISGRRPTYVDD